MAELSELISEPVALIKKRAATAPTAATTLIAYVSRKRLISQHLYFLDLQTPKPDQLFDVVLPCGHILQPGNLILPSDCRLAPDDMPLTLGGAMAEAMGSEESAQLMSQIRTGHILLVTAQFDTAEHAMVCLDCSILAEPALDGWEGGVWVGEADADQYFQLDIPAESIVLVDDVAKIMALGKHLAAVSAKADSSGIGWDCEWQPNRIKGDRNPVSLLQLAVDNEVYIIDLLRCCRLDVALGDDLTETEQLLSDALSVVLSSADVIKSCLQPSMDLELLCRSYHYMPCFAKFDGVADLCELGSHAALLADVLRDDRSSLSKLCEIVLGKKLNKAEQVSLCTYVDL
jgi:3'-5' exonuclease